jgi:hypothetical protein
MCVWNRESILSIQLDIVTIPSGSPLETAIGNTIAPENHNTNAPNSLFGRNHILSFCLDCFDFGSSKELLASVLSPLDWLLLSISMSLGDGSQQKQNMSTRVLAF